MIGEEPNGLPNNLMPYIAQVAAGKLSSLNIYGRDYLTPDGTGVRDYVHVVDLAEGHLAALEYVLGSRGWIAINLGTGRGTSVMEMVTEYENVINGQIPFNFIGRRIGDIASCYAKVDRAMRLLHWSAKKPLENMCITSWRLQTKFFDMQRDGSFF